MQNLYREDFRGIFKKVKKLRLPQDLENIDFSGLTYFSWIDQSDQICYLVYNYQGSLSGLRLKYLRLPAGVMALGFCEFCHQHRKKSEIIQVSCPTKNKPKNVQYRSRGTYICSDYIQCNQDIKDGSRLDKFFAQIFE